MEVVDDNGESLGIPQRYHKLPLTALRVSVRRVIALYLDDQSDIVDEDTGYVNDFNGLAEHVGFNYLEIKHFGRQKSPTSQLLEEWETRDELEPSIGKLWESLYILGRFDVMKDCQWAIVKDVEAFLRNKKCSEELMKPPLQISDVSQSTDHSVNERDILCADDVEKNTPQFFDAFVCYNAEGQDLKFVKDMITILEGDLHHLRLFIPERNGLPGAAKYVTDATLIEKRCKRMVIILSENFLRSPACDFQSKFAHALSPGARSKKLIPVLIEPMREIPQILRYVTLCDYTKVDLQEWFWSRLCSAIKQPLDPVASGWGEWPQMGSGSSASHSSSSILASSPGSLSSLASSNDDSALGQSMSSQANSRSEISNDISEPWVDLSQELSQNELEMTLSVSPPLRPFSSVQHDTAPVRQVGNQSMVTGASQSSAAETLSSSPSSARKMKKPSHLKSKLRQGFEKFEKTFQRGSHNSS